MSRRQAAIGSLLPKSRAAFCAAKDLYAISLSERLICNQTL
jgi:hypothetical protein